MLSQDIDYPRWKIVVWKFKLHTYKEPSLKRMSRNSQQNTLNDANKNILSW